VFYNVIPVKTMVKIYAIDIPKNIKDILDSLYLTGISTVEVKYA
jgi:hypothetical protein